eukprot:7661931-Alexandrium_andersonii.AAC.1
MAPKKQPAEKQGGARPKGTRESPGGRSEAGPSPPSDRSRSKARGDGPAAAPSAAAGAAWTTADS